MIETILLARVRKTGAYVPLSKAGDHWGALKAALAKIDTEVHDEYDRIGLYQLVPQKKVLKLETREAKSKGDAQRQTQEEDFKKADALAESSIEDLREIAAEMKLENVTPQTSRSELAAAIIAAQQAGKKKPALPPGANGPTIAEYVLAGYDPSSYPPTGYVSRSKPEEIAAAIAEFKSKNAQ